MALEGFDPNSAATSDSGIFGLPFSQEEAKLLILPVPWEATTSYGGGTSHGPQAIDEASRQVDLYDYDVEKPYVPGIHLLEHSKQVWDWNAEARERSLPIIQAGGDLENSPELQSALDRVNQLGDELNRYVLENVRSILAAGKIPAVLGGDHSVPFGAIQAMAEKERDFGILHFDAHSDTRKAYEGFIWSHASIMYNVLERIPEVTKIVQVGIRDFCEEEIEYCRDQGQRVKIFFDEEIKRRGYRGIPLEVTAKEIIEQLPKKVWISFDIDGLDPKLCPGTGTPVPGGLEFSEANYLLGELVRSGREIIGFDLNEVAPQRISTAAGSSDEHDEWDANVGARVLYKLCAWTFASRGLCRIRSS